MQWQTDLICEIVQRGRFYEIFNQYIFGNLNFFDIGIIFKIWTFLGIGSIRAVKIQAQEFKNLSFGVQFFK